MPDFKFSKKKKKISVNNNKEIESWADLQDEEEFSCCRCEAKKRANGISQE